MLETHSALTIAMLATRLRQCVSVFSILALALCEIADVQSQATVATFTGTSASGSQWRIEKPEDWNGTLLLWSHGWWPDSRAPEVAPRGMRDRLLDDGYALAGSTYATTGWAVADAVPDQLDVLVRFTNRFGSPQRVIAWGNSMGGLVSTALAERHAERIDGALPMCASSGGALGMLNSALDGAFAFVTLLAPDAGIRLVGVRDDRANAARVGAALDKALTQAAGRARVALASVLAGLPEWTNPTAARPNSGDYAARAAQMAESFVTGVFLPRAEQQRRAGGHVSWNTGVDYREQLERSGRRALIERLYADAGIDLDADLARLNNAPRVSPDPRGAAYMLANFTPSGRIGVPVLSLHTIGDGATSPSLQRAYLETIHAAGRGELAAAAWNDRAGHCTSTPGEIQAALQVLEARLSTGQWSVSPAVLNSAALAAGESQPSFVAHTPAPLPRACANRVDACPGYPASLQTSAETP